MLLGKLLLRKLPMGINNANLASSSEVGGVAMSRRGRKGQVAFAEEPLELQIGESSSSTVATKEWQLSDFLMECTTADPPQVSHVYAVVERDAEEMCQQRRKRFTDLMSKLGSDEFKENTTAVVPNIFNLEFPSYACAV